MSIRQNSIVVMFAVWMISSGPLLAALPEFFFAYSVSENSIDADSLTIEAGAVASSSGGLVSEATIQGTPAVIVTSFGQSFAGPAVSVSVSQQLVSIADDQYDIGARFLSEDTIWQKGLIDADGLDTLTGSEGTLAGIPTYDESALIQAEINYRKAVLINPWNTIATEGAVKARTARVLKGNFAWDFKQKRLFMRRYDEVGGGENTNGRIIKDEIAVLEEISAMQQYSIQMLLDIYGDPLVRGPGQLLRGEISIINSDVARDTHDLIFSTGRRFLTSEIFFGEKSLLLSFFNQGMDSNSESREAVVSRLKNSHRYFTGVLQLVNPFIDASFLESSDLPRLSGLQGRLGELMTLTNQGYNPFGFVPDFVPFLKSGAHENNLFTYNQLMTIVRSSNSSARDKEQAIVDDLEALRKFSQDKSDFDVRMEELQISYDSRLKTLIGTVIIEGNEVPDYYTSLYPDRDTDRDGIIDRDKARQNLAASEGFTFGAKGQVAEQYQVIEITETRAEQAFNSIQNAVGDIEGHERHARRVSEILENQAESIFLLIQENANEVGLLIRQKARLQATAVNREAARQHNNLAFGGLTSLVAGFVGEKPSPSVVASGLSQFHNAATMTAFPGQVIDASGKIDAQIAEIQAMERAEIQMVQMEASKAILLSETQQQIGSIARRQANLGLDFYIAQRDIDREINRLGNIYGEVNTLLADYERIKTLREKNFDDEPLGWVKADVRDVVSKEILIADNALKRAQIWAFVALRALEYYANKPPAANGQPHDQIRDLYKQLYWSRRTEDIDDLLAVMDERSTSQFIFSLSGSSCPSRGLLSLKYDVLAPATVNYNENGSPAPGGVQGETNFTYTDPSTGVTYDGSLAFQAMFKQALRVGFVPGAIGFRELRLRFATNLFPDKIAGNLISANPFYRPSVTNSKIVGWTAPGCSGVGVPENAQGVSVNLTGNLSLNPPTVDLSQLGNSYLKHTPWEDEDFDGQVLKNPLENLTVYSSYKQILPSFLISSEYDPTAEPEWISSDVKASIDVLRNGQGSSGTGKTLEFTDRAVANDQWEILIKDRGSANTIFLNRLEEMLAEPEPSPATDLLTDIQLWVGWSYRN